MRIIIEGPNNVGKSTLISKILMNEKFKNYKVEHCSQFCPNDRIFHETLLKQNKNIIFDRFFIGEQVYSEIFKRKKLTSLDDISELMNVYLDTLIIFVDADYEFISKAYENKKELKNWKFIYDERKKFNDLYEWCLQKWSKSRVVQCVSRINDNYYLNDFDKEKVIDFLSEKVDFYENAKD